MKIFEIEVPQMEKDVPILGAWKPNCMCACGAASGSGGGGGEVE